MCMHTGFFGHGGVQLLGVAGLADGSWVSPDGGGGAGAALSTAVSNDAGVDGADFWIEPAHGLGCGDGESRAAFGAVGAIFRGGVCARGGLSFHLRAEQNVHRAVCAAGHRAGAKVESGAAAAGGEPGTARGDHGDAGDHLLGGRLDQSLQRRRLAGACGQFETGGGGLSPDRTGSVGGSLLAGWDMDGWAVWDTGFGDRCADLVSLAADSLLGALGRGRVACGNRANDAECGAVQPANGGVLPAVCQRSVMAGGCAKGCGVVAARRTGESGLTVPILRMRVQTDAGWLRVGRWCDEKGSGSIQ